MLEGNNESHISAFLDVIGCEDIKNAPFTFESEHEYFMRERMENRRESGMRIPDKWVPADGFRPDEEASREWLRAKWLQEIVANQTNRPDTEYCGQESEEKMDTSNAYEWAEYSVKNQATDKYNDQTVVINISESVRLIQTRRIYFNEGKGKGIKTSRIKQVIQIIKPASKGKPEELVKEVVQNFGFKENLILWSNLEKTRAMTTQVVNA
jgi:hypothetical protein